MLVDRILFGTERRSNPGHGTKYNIGVAVFPVTVVNYCW